MAKRKPKAYTLAVFWKNINTVVPKYLDKSDNSSDELYEKVQAVVDEVNASTIPKSIGDLFVEPYLDDPNMNVKFVVDPLALQDEFSRPVKYKAGEERNSPSWLLVDVVGLFRYAKAFKNAEAEFKKDADSEMDFKDKRQFSFMKELLKLPPPYLVYLAVLQELAYCNDIVSVEDREGNFHKSDAGFYLSLLWAFKEFETFYLRAQNRSLRADYGIIWHEGEWVQDSKRSRGYV